jgi:chromosome segregation ATPase
VQDFLFYNAGCTEPRGLGRLVVPFRRLIRRILRPVFLRQVDLFQDLAAQIEAVARQCAELHACLQGQARRQEALLEHLRATLAEQANREEQARQSLENGLRAAQTSELAQYRQELERYLSDCDAMVQRLTLIDEDLERLHGRGNGKSRPAA